MKYFTWAATPEVDRQALTAIAERARAEFGAPVSGRSSCPNSISPLMRPAAQYGSIPMLEMLVRLCPGDAFKVLGLTERDLFIPVLTFVFGSRATGRPRGGWFRSPACGRNSTGLEPNREVFLERAQKECCTNAATCSGWYIAGTAVAPCRWRPACGRIDFKRAAFLRPLRGADRTETEG